MVPLDTLLYECVSERLLEEETCSLEQVAWSGEK